MMIKWMAILLVGGWGLTSCYRHRVEQFIPGVYQAHWTTPYSKVTDTLQIQLQQEGSQAVYRLTRRTHISYTRQREPTYKVEHWMGEWKKDRQTLVIPANGRLLFFDPRNQALTMGIITYQKISA